MVDASIKFSPMIDALIGALNTLPGIGPKSAQRMAFFILQKDKRLGRKLVESLNQALDKVGRCGTCRNFAEVTPCHFCADQKRDDKLLCVVESPLDVLAVEQTGHFNGLYFVLMGNLSPIDGIGPEHLGLDTLQQRLALEPMDEVIIATNPTVEGEATAHYIVSLLENLPLQITRLASGVPMGGELEFLDTHTLSHAFVKRQSLLSVD